MTDARWTRHRDRDALVPAAAATLRRIARGALAEHSEALIAVPGGGTPVPILKEFAGFDLDWPNITIVPGDDRLVPADDPLSNFGMIAGLLAETGARLVPLIGTDLSDDAAGHMAAERLGSLSWPPDLVWLGVGADGHTASIFPGPDYENALASEARAVYVMPNPLPPEAPAPRVTLSASAIRSARHILVTITGEEKRSVLERALAEGADSGFPVGHVLAGTAPTIHWSP